MYPKIHSIRSLLPLWVFFARDPRLSFILLCAEIPLVVSRPLKSLRDVLSVSSPAISFWRALVQSQPFSCFRLPHPGPTSSPSPLAVLHFPFSLVTKQGSDSLPRWGGGGLGGGGWGGGCVPSIGSCITDIYT